MEFGLGFWILFFVIFFGCGRMCGWGKRRHRDRPEELESSGGKDDRLKHLESRVAGRAARRERLMSARRQQTDSRAGEPRPVPTRARKETPLQELQKRFVEGRLTLGEYERELDLLDRID